MLRRFGIVLMAVLLTASLVMAQRVNSKVTPRVNLPVITGNETIDMSRAIPDDGRGVRPVLDDTYQAGTTWYDYQHNGTAGKMVGVDNSGFVHVVWMNGLNAGNNPRHVYYNIWDPTSEQFVFLPSGSQVNSSPKAGYVSMANSPGGFCYPSFHETSAGNPDSAHAAAAIDFLPGSGAFTASQPAYINGYQLIWPKIAIGPDSTLHMVSTQFAVAGGDPQNVYYSRGVPVFDSDGFGLDIEWQVVDGVDDEFMWVDSCMTIAVDVAASAHSNRVVMAWTHNRDDYTTQIDNDLYISISEDGGLNWGPRINVTNFVPGDPSCPSGDTLACNNDTLRLYTDCSALIDENDNIHVAFSVRTWYDVGYPGPDGFVGPSGWISQSGIFHWSEEFEEFSPVANDYHFQTVEGGTLVDNGAWQLNTHRPSLCEDTETGYMYCSFQRYDSNQYSDNGFPMGDAWVAASWNCGRSWSVAVNVTNTDGGQNTPAPGSLSERDITLARYTSEGLDGERYLHMSYVLDRDAGGLPQAEGIATQNPFYYHRIPVDDIPLTPVLDPFWPAMHVDSTGFPGSVIPLDPEVAAPCVLGIGDDLPSLRPESFALYQNYPNPFNPTTKIVFDLVRDARVTLKVYNVMGQEVATLFDGKALTAGVQNVEFDASTLTSGVYVYRLNVDGVSASRKMVLMK